MLDIPSWLEKNINKNTCPECGKSMEIDGVKGIGIKYSTRDKDKTVFCFEYECPHCGNRVFVETDYMSVEDFVMNMLDQYTDPEMEDNENDEVMIEEEEDYLNFSMDNSVKNKVSKISEKEMIEVKNKLNSMEFHDDFLRLLSFSEKEIENLIKEGIEERKRYLKDKNV